MQYNVYNNNNKLHLLKSSQNAQPTSVAQDSNSKPKAATQDSNEKSDSARVLQGITQFLTCHPHTNHSLSAPRSQGNRPLTGTKLYCLVTEAQRCEKLAQSFYAMAPGRDSNPRPHDRKFDALPQHHDATFSKSCT